MLIALSVLLRENGSLRTRQRREGSIVANSCASSTSLGQRSIRQHS
jgi:hypothetical protein